MKKTLFTLSLLGLAFSGYLGGVKLFSGTCAFNQSCPYFLGYPACFYGFFMYVIITLAATKLVFCKRGNPLTALPVLYWTSLVGMIFSGYFVAGELPDITTCTLGFVMYIVIFVMTIMIKKNASQSDSTPEISDEVTE